MRVEVAVPNERTIVLDDGVLTGKLPPHPSLPRRCYAAGHVVMLASYANVAHSLDRPGSPDEIAEHVDWDATMALRTRVDRLGMGVAEAMDTAQRFELGWTGAKELLRRTGELGLENGFVGAASADHISEVTSLDALADAIVEQVVFVRECGGVPIILPQVWLTQNGATEGDYVALYLRIADAAGGEILIHWLGEIFHAGMRGYFPGDSARLILSERPDAYRGIKLSLLDREFEEQLRRELTPRGQVILTGDDYNFSGLIEGASQDTRPLKDLGGRPLAGGDFSHALLGIFDATARPAAAALARLGAGDTAGYRALMEPCEELGRLLFEAPVPHYKAGIAFLSWLNGLQSNPMLANHEQNARPLEHYIRVAELASRAGVIENATLAAERLTQFVNAPRRVHGAS